MEVEEYYSFRDEIESRLTGFDQHDVGGLLINIANRHKLLAFVVSREDFERMAWGIDVERWEEVLRHHDKCWINEILLEALATYVVNMPHTSEGQQDDQVQ